LAKSRRSERSKISLLEDNSLEIGTGNFIAPNREFIETSRDLQRLAGNAHYGIDSAAIEVKLRKLFSL
jgi:hypothetical protein